MSTTLWIQLLGILFSIAMIYLTFLKYKRKEINKLEFLMWAGGWILLMALAIVPSVLDPIIGKLNFYRRLDFFVVLGFFTLLWIGFYNYSLVKKMEKKVELFVRNQAIQEQPIMKSKDALKQK